MSMPYRLGTAAAPLRRPAIVASPHALLVHPRTGQRFQLRAKGDIVNRMGRELENRAKKTQSDFLMSQAQREAAASEFKSGTMPMFPSKTFPVTGAQPPFESLKPNCLEHMG